MTTTLRVPGSLTETRAGTILLDGLAAYRRGDFAAARTAAHEARMASGSAFAARYADSLAYDAIAGYPPRVAEGSVRRFLIAVDDIRYLDFPPSYSVPPGQGWPHVR